MKILSIREDDYGCEERPEGWEPMVLVALGDGSGGERLVRVGDRFLREHGLEEGGEWPEGEVSGIVFR